MEYQEIYLLPRLLQLISRQSSSEESSVTEEEEGAEVGSASGNLLQEALAEVQKVYREVMVEVEER